MTRKWWVGFIATASLVLWATLLLIASFAYADEFPTITQTSNSASTFDNVGESTPSIIATDVAPATIQKTFDPLPFIILGVLVAVLVVIAVARKKYAKK